MKLLMIHAGLNEQSISRKIAEELGARLLESDPGSDLTVRDLVQESIAHWTEPQVRAAFTSSQARSPEQKLLLAQSDQYCHELLNCTHLIVSSPMWNFSIPSILKSWIDHIVRLGLTFDYGAQGPLGLATQIKNVYIVESSGGNYIGSQASQNHVAPYLETVFKFIGAEKIHVISAQGTAYNLEVAQGQASQQMKSLFQTNDNGKTNGH